MIYRSRFSYPILKLISVPNKKIGINIDKSKLNKIKVIVTFWQFSNSRLIPVSRFRGRFTYEIDCSYIRKVVNR